MKCARRHRGIHGGTHHGATHAERHRRTRPGHARSERAGRRPPGRHRLGLGLLALGLSERDWTTAAGTTHALLLTGYLCAGWATGLLPWHHPADPAWIDGPQAKALLLATILLLPGLAAWAAATRRRKQPAPTGPRTVTP
ncbi:hypothetical protein [Streptomyces sp. NPDC058373]|uniref:hypothetical protein n=1 Tax=Streptomyces sp. NPDC058373 TaxID=3346465 RepID=UPI003652AC35